ncbi:MULTISPECIES: hypothetical protein [Corynebacterium]|uniref:hypothetical protein n=1 Tax=Corynebacterium TaxID=1716 RepID=UPI0019D3F161|nr:MULTISPECIES: hypothetical protein [Corynebacterium]MCT1547804.1 hypothetical protein [Corynebacterium amycolatum]
MGAVYRLNPTRRRSVFRHQRPRLHHPDRRHRLRAHRATRGAAVSVPAGHRHGARARTPDAGHPSRLRNRRAACHGPGRLRHPHVLEPAISVPIGAIVLAQVPLPIQVLGIVLVVAAGIGSERFAARDVSPTPITWPESDEA